MLSIYLGAEIDLKKYI